MSDARDLHELLNMLDRERRVSLGVGEPNRRGWFRAQVVAHDTAAGRLVLAYTLDRASDRQLEPGERVIVAPGVMDDAAHSVSMQVEHSTAGPQATVHLHTADGSLEARDDRRHQARVPLQIRALRARRWVGGAWRDLEATVIDLSSRGVGLTLNQRVHIGDRLSLSVPLDQDAAELKVMLEIRHVQPMPRAPEIWRAGGLFRNLPTADHERVIRFIFAELRSRQLPP